MNNLPFDSKPLQYYGNTFLQRVIVEFNFDIIKKESVPSTFKDELCHFLAVHFGISCEDNMIDAFWEDGVQLSKDDKSIIWHLRTDGISVMIGANDYKSFVDSVLPTVYKMRSFFRRVLGLESVSGLQVRKLNAWQFHDVKPNSLKAEDLRHAILSSALINYQLNSELSSLEKSIQGLKKISFTEGCESLVIRHFYRNLNSEVMVLFLDTERTINQQINEKEIENCLVDMNKDLYNAFHWCVTKQVLNIMKGGK